MDGWMDGLVQNEMKVCNNNNNNLLQIIFIFLINFVTTLKFATATINTKTIVNKA